MNLINQILKEGKQRGELYHFTSLYNVNLILKENFLRCHINRFKRSKNELYGFSLTRDKNMFKNAGLIAGKMQVGLIFDGDKISNDFKIVPFNYYGNENKTRDLINQKYNEFEEKVIVNNESDFKVNKYLIGIIFNNDLIEEESRISMIYKNEIIQYFESKNLKITELGKVLQEELDYGEKLFAGEKKFKKVSDGEEKNTPEEEKIFKDIKRFIKSPTNKKEIKKDIEELEPLRNKFPKILKPQGQFAYRGMILSKSFFENYDFQDENLSSKFVLLIKDFIFNTNSSNNISSWTTDITIAEVFADCQGITNRSVILRTKIDDGFIFNQEFTNIISKAVLGLEEGEIICYKENIKCDAFCIPSQFKN